MSHLFNTTDKNKSYNKLTTEQQNFLESFAECDQEAWNEFRKNKRNEKYNFLMSFNNFLKQVNELESMTLSDIISQLKKKYNNNKKFRNLKYDQLPYFIRYILNKHNITTNEKLQQIKSKDSTGGKKKKKVIKKRKPTGKKKVRKIHKGPRGGRYYISKGKKVYL